MKCKNCEFEFEGNYCPNCGQNASVKRFTYSYFLRETFFSSLDIEQGFFSSLRDLFIKPGHAIRNYLEGKRLNLAVPGKYLLLMGAVSTFLAVQLQIFEVPAISEYLMWLPMIEGLFEFAAKYATLTNIIAIPVFAFFSWIVFRNKGYNYAENTILNIFITSQQLLMLIILVPILQGFNTMNSQLIGIYTIITVIYNVWVYIQFFKLRLVPGLLMSLISISLSYVVQFFLNYFLYILIPQSWIEYLS